MLYYDVARILTTHGLQGEVKVDVITDFPDQRFAKGATLFCKDHLEQKLTVRNARPFQKFWLVQFDEIESVEQAKTLLQEVLVVEDIDQQNLPQGTYYYHELLGAEILDEATHVSYGTLQDIEAPGANDIWQVVSKDGTSFWLPNISTVVKRIDLDDHKIYVHLLEGLRDEN